MFRLKACNFTILPTSSDIFDTLEKLLLKTPPGSIFGNMGKTVATVSFYKFLVKPRKSIELLSKFFIN